MCDERAYAPAPTESGSTTMPNVLKATFGGSATVLALQRTGFSFSIEIYHINLDLLPHTAIATRVYQRKKNSLTLRKQLYCTFRTEDQFGQVAQFAQFGRNMQTPTLMIWADKWRYTIGQNKKLSTRPNWFYLSLQKSQHFSRTFNTHASLNLA
jgi:hypothetical protein